MTVSCYTAPNNATRCRTVLLMQKAFVRPHNAARSSVGFLTVISATARNSVCTCLRLQTHTAAAAAAHAMLLVRAPAHCVFWSYGTGAVTCTAAAHCVRPPRRRHASTQRTHVAVAHTCITAFCKCCASRLNRHAAGARAPASAAAASAVRQGADAAGRQRRLNAKEAKMQTLMLVHRGGGRILCCRHDSTSITLCVLKICYLLSQHCLAELNR
jgi:hypothetical protein